MSNAQRATNVPVPATSTKVITGMVRFSYLNAFQPRASDEGQEPKYSVCLLIPKTDKKTLGKIRAAIEAARLSSAGLFNGKVPTILKDSLHDGDGPKPSGDDYGPEAKGCYVLNCSSKTKPGIVDADCQTILDSTELYSGCYGRASINFFAYNTKGNRGVGCGLNNLQKLEDGESLGGRSRAEDDFGEDDGDLLD